MHAGGKLLAEVRDQLVGAIIPGVKPIELDELADRLIKEAGGTPSFKSVPGYRWATCITINDGVVHGVPTVRSIRNGELVSIDIGMRYRGFHTDTATTVVAGKVTREKERFLTAGRTALRRAVEEAVAGRRIGHISRAIEKTIEEEGYSCVTTLIGHGIGKRLHEDPPIPCVLVGNIHDTPPIKDGRCLAIEVIYTRGGSQLTLGEDGWTLSTEDGSDAGLFEDTVMVRGAKPLVLTAGRSAIDRVEDPWENGRFVIK